MMACSLGLAAVSLVPASGSSVYLYTGATLLAFTSATVVGGLTALASFSLSADRGGEDLGRFRAWGQLGRAAGPGVASAVYWMYGGAFAYRGAAVGVLGAVIGVWMCVAGWGKRRKVD